jgi:hypothetical protein
LLTIHIQDHNILFGKRKSVHLLTKEDADACKQSRIKTNDHQLAGRFAPEVVGFGFYHQPGDELAVNGFKSTIRIGDKTFQVEVSEGKRLEEGNGKQMTGYLASGEKFLGLVQGRQRLLEEVQTRILGAATTMLTLLDDINVKQEH